MTHHPTDERFMHEALALARHALGRTAPNPAVGAVVVRDRVVVGRGWTRPAGQSHAEVVALAEAGEKARGATLYVTLEPCCHHGRTPPCADAVIAAGVRRCVVATVDPFPAVDGGGIARLRQTGVTVHVGVAEGAAQDLIDGFRTRVRTGRTMVTAKYAMTLDGRIATATGQSRWITGEEARGAVHLLRDRSDAIMVGAGTVIADDPELTTRLPVARAGDGGPHDPLRVVVDGRGSVPLSARVLSTGSPRSTLVATTSAAPSAWQDCLRERGVEVVPCGDGPRVDLAALLDELGRRGVNALLVEGGHRLHGSLFDAGLVDRVVAFVAPVIVGGAQAPGPVGGRGVERMSEAVRLTGVRVRRLGDDLVVEGAVATTRAEEAA